MTQFRPLSLDLPPAEPEQPPAAWIHTCGFCGPFGITASVADFAEVLDWQEKRRALTQGYYRLIHPPRVQRFKARLEKKYPGFEAVLYASAPLAAVETRDALAVRGVDRAPVIHRGLPSSLEGEGPHILDLRDGEVLAGVLLTPDPELAAEAHERNRRRGGALSARNVAWFLNEPDATAADPAVEQTVRQTLLELEGARDVLFYPSGMGAVTAALEAARALGGNRVLVMGNVYRDTHLLLEEMPWPGRDMRAEFLDTRDLDGLRDKAGAPDVAAVFFETITNPLIEIPDMPAIARIARGAGVPVLVDGTMATPRNCRPLEHGADAVIHSTSKYLSGNNAHGGGAVLSRDPKWIDTLRDQQRARANILSPLEYPVLWAGMSTFGERMERFNRNGRELAAALAAHPAVDRVWFGADPLPPWIKGLGSVVSCELKDPSREALAAVFDAPMPGVVKAPSLGSDKTLFCPYVLLTYYDKPDKYLSDCNLPRHLLRFAVGCEEDFLPVRNGILAALETARP